MFVRGTIRRKVMERVNVKIDLAEKEYYKHCEEIDKSMDEDIVKEKERHNAKLQAIEVDGQKGKTAMMEQLVSDMFKSLGLGK